MNEAEQFQRQWRLYQRLSTFPDGETLADLADRYEVSTKTIQRDIATLRAVGLEVVEATEKFGLVQNGWFWGGRRAAVAIGVGVPEWPLRVRRRGVAGS